MRPSEMTRQTPGNARVVAQPPIGRRPFDPKEPLPVSRRRVRVGLLLLISSFAVGVGSAFFPAAKSWLIAACVLLWMCSSWILGLHRLRPRGRESRKLYGHQRF
jgi:hypothetical protein